MSRYPIAYTLLVLPLSIARWISFTRPDETVPSWATFLVNTIYNLSGFVNVFLLLVLRRTSGLLGGENDDEEEEGEEYPL
jgi:hypothetical protein